MRDEYNYLERQYANTDSDNIKLGALFDFVCDYFEVNIEDIRVITQHFITYKRDEGRVFDRRLILRHICSVLKRENWEDLNAVSSYLAKRLKLWWVTEEPKHLETIKTEKLIREALEAESKPRGNRDEG